MNDTAHKTALHLSSTINDLAGLIDDYVSQLLRPTQKQSYSTTIHRQDVGHGGHGGQTAGPCRHGAIILLFMHIKTQYICSIFT
jgi:hypothetical protein